MRDPDGAVLFEGDRVKRVLKHTLPHDHFLRSPLAREFVARGWLLPFEQTDELTLEAPRLPFVTYPSEWCDPQLFDAGLLTLDLAAAATESTFELKDASAWNVLFDGSTPRFCDLLSFGLLQGRAWWAAGQFGRHFLLPLQLARSRGLRGYQAFACWRDGVPSQSARSLMGWRRFTTRVWPAMAGASAGETAPAAPMPASSPDADRRFRRRLHESLRWMLSGLDPRGHKQSSHWERYVNDRAHYPGSSLETKRATVQNWLRQAAPAWVADLGCNTGEFTRMALDQGASVVAIDSDHESIAKLYLSHRAGTRLHTIVVPLDDLCAGRGWLGQEHVGLHTRCKGKFDLVMMLALVHHLAIGASIPLAQVAAMACAWTRNLAIIEWLHEGDTQLALLCSQRRRDPAEFSIERQRQAFIDAGFCVEAEIQLAPATRTLALLRKRR